MSNGYGRRDLPQSQSPFHGVYSKYPSFAGGIQEFVQNLMACREWKNVQRQRQWERGISERELDIGEKKAEQQKPL